MSGEMKAYVLLILAAIAAACAVIWLAEKDGRCLETQRQNVVTYPNAGLAWLGPQYLGIAFVPVAVEVDVCVRFEVGR